MKPCITVLSLFLSLGSIAQPTSFDLIQFSELKGWKKEVKVNSNVKYSKVDAGTGGWCQVVIYHSTRSKGSVDADFSSEWKELVVKAFPDVQGLKGDSAAAADGWEMKAASGHFTFNNSRCIMLLTTFSGYNTCSSILANTNNPAYLNEVYDFMKSVSLKKPSPTGKVNTVPATTNLTPATTVADRYTFTTTSWDDGWTSTPQADWVEVSKADVKVLIHYNGIPGEQYESDRMVTNKNAWDNIIVPRYTNLTNYEYLRNNASYIPVYMMAGNLVDKAGNNVFAVVFRSGGRENSWQEFIFPNRQRFTQMFGIDKYDSYTTWDVLTKMRGYNKFAVALSDLKGTWTNSFSGMTQYVNVYTGASAGATASSSAQEYVFDGAGNYNWTINAASGMVGNLKFQNAKSTGKATLTSNWQLHLSNIENRPRDYPVSFSCMKGARVLWIDGQAFVRK